MLLKISQKCNHHPLNVNIKLSQYLWLKSHVTFLQVQLNELEQVLILQVQVED